MLILQNKRQLVDDLKLIIDEEREIATILNVLLRMNFNVRLVETNVVVDSYTYWYFILFNNTEIALNINQIYQITSKAGWLKYLFDIQKNISSYEKEIDGNVKIIQGRKNNSKVSKYKIYDFSNTDYINRYILVSKAEPKIN